MRVIGIVASVTFLLISAVAPAVAERIGDPAFQRTWDRADRAVAEGVAVRSWLWGPEAFTFVFEEPYAESPGGVRHVQYFDKARMEITNPDGDPSSEWYVTNGLLAKELITGERQVGNNAFEIGQPAEVGVAGDPDDATGPTYATFSRITHQPSRPLGVAITDVLGRDGSVTVDAQLAIHGVTSSRVEPLTGYTTASVFQAFIDAQGTVWENGSYTTGTVAGVFAVGLPITEAYWAKVKVAGSVKDVLVQCFERRCLTFTPSNDPAWQVEMGNVGQHDYRWHYGSMEAQETGDISMILRPLDSDQGEYVRLMNYNMFPIQLAGWTMHDIGPEFTYTFSDYVLMPGMSVWVLNCTGTETEDTLFTGRCGNWWDDIDSITIKDATGAVIVYFEWEYVPPTN